MAKRISYICRRGTYHKGDEPCNCELPNTARMPDAPILHIGTFKPYTEMDGPGKPRFETREQRDSWCAANGFGYDRDSSAGAGRKPTPLLTPAVQDKIMQVASEGPAVLPTITPDERSEPRVTV